MKQEEVEIKTAFWPNVQKYYEAPYVNDLVHGIETRWNPNGQKSSEIPWVNGQLHGFATWWHPNGKKRAEIPYVNGQRHGIEWCCNGSLRFVRKWHQNQILVEFEFDESQVPGDAKMEIHLLKGYRFV